MDTNAWIVVAFGALVVLVMFRGVIKAFIGILQSLPPIIALGLLLVIAIIGVVLVALVGAQ